MGLGVGVGSWGLGLSMISERGLLCRIRISDSCDDWRIMEFVGLGL